jgi:hypothetical protein
VDRALIIELVKQTIAELRKNAAPQRVLTLFSGASTGFVAGMGALKMMIAQGHPVTVVLTHSAVSIITEAQVRKAGASDIILPNQWVDAPSLAQETDLMLIPTLSINTAARLATGLMDNLVTTLVMGALLAGKPVLAVRDGADPYGRGGQVFGAKPGVATALKDKLAHNLNSLTSFGIELIDEPDFLTTVEARLLGFGAAMRVSPVGVCQQPLEPEPVFAPAPGPGTTVITVENLLGFPAGASLTIPSNARFTPLAQDMVKRLKLKVVMT